MTFRNREENYASSEALALPPGYLPYQDQFAFQDWSQSTAFPSPVFRDSFSDCPSLVDSPETASFTFSPISSPVGGPTVPAMENRTLYDVPENDLYPLHGSVAAQELQRTVSWLTAADGTVDSGSSPTQSYDSQSIATPCPPFEPDVRVYPQAGLSFSSEPNYYGAVACPSPYVPLPYPQDLGNPYACHQNGLQPGCMPPVTTDAFPGSLPNYYFQSGQVASSKPLVPIRPRTEAPPMPQQPTYGSQRILAPNVSGHRLPQAPTRIVSNAVSAPQDISQACVSSSVTCAPVMSCVAPGLSTMVYPVDPTAEDFDAFISCEQEEPAAPELAYGPEPTHMNHLMPAYPILPLEQGPTPPAAAQPLVGERRQDGPISSGNSASPALSNPMSRTSSGQNGEHDEGRFRTSPHYSRGPQADGMYRCPWKDTENCAHKDTKLKCNYDKYVDSHLKPFRCKEAECARLEFSSTACRLRHEREAHGAHGHGNNPHHCYYEGCDRGPGNRGFPRRYNLFDHMKRVHDYKEGALDARGNPISGQTVAAKKNARGVKRKADEVSPGSSRAGDGRPVAQRPRVVATPRMQVQVQQPRPGLMGAVAGAPPQEGYFFNPDFY